MTRASRGPTTPAAVRRGPHGVMVSGPRRRNTRARASVAPEGSPVKRAPDGPAPRAAVVPAPRPGAGASRMATASAATQHTNVMVVPCATASAVILQSRPRGHSELAPITPRVVRMWHRRRRGRPAAGGRAPGSGRGGAARPDDSAAAAAAVRGGRAPGRARPLALARKMAEAVAPEAARR